MSERTRAATDQDPYLWLEEIDSAEVRAWVEARNAETAQALCDARFDADRRTLLDLLNADDRIPAISRRGQHVYNFWQDAAHPKGLWRRTTLVDYRNPAPAWELLIDVDALARQEGEDWVWRGFTALPPDFRCGLVNLSRGGADAVTLREFDLRSKGFVEDGFALPEAKTSAAWADPDRLLIASPLGGESFETESGYARTVRLWRRGTPFVEAPVVFEAERNHVYVHASRTLDAARSRTLFSRYVDFVRHETFVDGPAGPQPLDIPSDCYLSVAGEWLALNLRSDWNVGELRHPAGALLVIAFEAFLAGDRAFTTLFEPSPTCFLTDYAQARDVVAFGVLDTVRSRVAIACWRGGRWLTEPVDGGAPGSVLTLQELDTDYSHGADGEEGDEFLLSAQSAISAPSLSLVRQGEPPQPLKQSPARFDAIGLAITQHFVQAEDGVRIPYFQIGRADLALDGENATLLTGYGGFQISSLPYYSVSAGRLWLARGGVQVIANIRGGGEFGPDWHKAGIREAKKRAQNDFAVVARDLIARRVTSPARLACHGGSNGGLLVGNMLTRFSELFGAIVCAVPLLDMRRYSHLTAGASWIAEYGDPDVAEDWAFLRDISAYQLVAPGKDYPPILLTTSGRDDRVHPGHARKMAAKLSALGYRVRFHEPQGGGHAGATDNAQLAHNAALTYAFLHETIAPEMAGEG